MPKQKAKTTTKINKAKEKKEKRPTQRQKKAFAILSENDGISLRQALLKAGYSDEMANNPHRIVNSLGWQTLSSKVFPDESMEHFAQYHQALLNRVSIEKMTFPRHMEVEEIIDHMASFGLKVVTITHDTYGKHAHYAQVDARAVKDALDMVYKMKGLYKDDKDPKQGDTFNLNLFFNNMETIRRKYENGTPIEVAPASEVQEIKMVEEPKQDLTPAQQLEALTGKKV